MSEFRRRLMMTGLKPVSTLVPYIRGGADGSYIDTGITPDNTTKVIVWARNFNPACGWFFGSRIAWSNSSFLVVGELNAHAGDIRLDYANNRDTYATDQFNNMSCYHKYELYGGVLSVDDVEIVNVTDQSFSNNHSIHLLGLNNNGTHANSALPIDICACKIFKNDVLVRDYSAVNSPSVGLFDAVSNTLFTNAGGGSFTYGTFNSDAYTPLSYIACDGQQYFDTGLYGNQDTKVVTKFRPTSTTKTYYRLFGTRNEAGGSDLMTELMIGNNRYANRYCHWRYKSSTGSLNTGSSQTNNDLVYIHDKNSFTVYKNNAQLGTSSTTASTYTTPNTMYVGSSNIDGSGSSYAFYGYIFYIGFGADKNFVPAKVNNIAGMYDTYNDVFYTSESGTPFIAGPSI